MRNLILKLHIYAGLLTFTHLMIFGIAGVVASVQRAAERPKVPHTVRHETFRPPQAATDKQVADAVYQQLKLPLTRPMPLFAIKRNADNNLQLDFYNINGIYRVVVLEQDGMLSIDEIRNGWPIFLEDMHAITIGDPEAPRPVRIWAFYNEFAMWCLLAFVVSGGYLWLSAPERTWWAWGSLAAGMMCFAALWMAFR
jgi:uncharacterized iron-regulated membrane protein